MKTRFNSVPKLLTLIVLTDMKKSFNDAHKVTSKGNIKKIEGLKNKEPQAKYETYQRAVLDDDKMSIQRVKNEKWATLLYVQNV